MAENNGATAGVLDLVKFAAPLEPVRFPNGQERAVSLFGPAEWELWRKVQRSGDDEDAATLLARCVPDATTEDLATLTPEMARAIILHAQGKIALVLDALGKGDAPQSAGPSPSSRPTRRNTSSRGSPGRSAAGRTSSGTPPTT